MQLGKPGGGLPRSEFLLIRLLFIPIVRTLFTWQIAFWLFEREVRHIIKLADRVKSEEFQRQVIIDKTFAIEDHSRQFSVNMVLEHLCIVGRKITQVIAALSVEKEFEEVVAIEGVKPFENKPDALSDFAAFAGEYEEFYKTMPKKQSEMTKPHPWFMEFNNFDWHAFIYMHTFIHRRQIEAIINELERSR
jgi:hypothetical protein